MVDLGLINERFFVDFNESCCLGSNRARVNSLGSFINDFGERGSKKLDRTLHAKEKAVKMFGKGVKNRLKFFGIINGRPL